MIDFSATKTIYCFLITFQKIFYIEIDTKGKPILSRFYIYFYRKRFRVKNLSHLQKNTKVVSTKRNHLHEKEIRERLFYFNHNRAMVAVFCIG